MNAPDAIGTAAELRDVPGFGGRYAVTADGRVWAKPRQWRTGAGENILRGHGGQWIKPHVDARGYVGVGLNVDGEKQRAHVHRLVALAWIPNPLGLPQVNHINAQKGDNRAVNLEWCSAAENKRHAVALGLCLTTDALRSAARLNARKAHAATRKLTHDQAQQARQQVAGGARKTAVAAAFQISRASLDSILKGKTYATK